MTKDSVNTDLLNFLTNATTPFHTVGVMAERLLAAGFAPWSDSSREPIVAGGKYFTVRNDSSLIAFTAGKDVMDVQRREPCRCDAGTSGAPHR